MTQVTINGNTYSDDGTAAKDMQHGGHRQWLLPMIGDVATVGAAAQASETNAGLSESAAAQSALDAANYAAAINATSTTSLTIGTGEKVFTVQAGKQFTAGQFVIVTRSGGAGYMWGTCTSYAGTTLTLDIQISSGTGTYTDWIISLSSPRGSDGTSAPMTVTTKSTTYEAVVGDIGVFFACTGAFTFSFTAAATLGNGWYCFLQNRGTGTVTLDPNGSETINGATTLATKIGDVYLVTCDGINFIATLLQEQKFSHDRSTLITSDTGTFTVPAGIYAIRAYLFGAGGRAGAQSGGGGGSCSYGTIPTTPGTVFTFGISGTTVTLKVGSTTYLTSNSGADGGSTLGGAGGAAGSVGTGLNIYDSGAYAGGNGGGSGITGARGGGGSSGSPLGAGKAGGSGNTVAKAAGGGGGWGGTGGSSGYKSAGGGGGVGGYGYVSEGDAYSGGGGGAGGAAVSGGLGGIGRNPGNYFTDPLLSICVGSGGNGWFSSLACGIAVSGQPGGGGGGTHYGSGGNGGFGGGGGGSAYISGGAAGDGGFGGGGGGSAYNSGGNGGIGGGSGAPYATAGSAAVLIMY